MNDRLLIAIKKLSDKKSSYKHLIKIGEESSEFKTEIYKTINKALSISNERLVNELSDLLNTLEIYFTSLNIEYECEYEEKFEDKSPTEVILHLGKLNININKKIIKLIEKKILNKITEKELEMLLIDDKLIHKLKKIHRNIYKYLKFVKIDLKDIEEYRLKQVEKHL